MVIIETKSAYYYNSVLLIITASDSLGSNSKSYAGPVVFVCMPKQSQLNAFSFNWSRLPCGEPSVLFFPALFLNLDKIRYLT